MQRNNADQSAFSAISQLRNDIRKSYQIADTEQTDTTSPNSRTIDRLKETSDLFVLGREKLGSPEGRLIEVENAVTRAKDTEIEVAALRAEKMRLQAIADSHRSKAGATGSVAEVEAFVAYAKELSELHDQLALSRIVFKAVLAKSLEDIRDERLGQQDRRFIDPQSWEVKKGVLKRALQSLRSKTDQLCLSAETYLDADEALFLDVMGLATEAADHVRRGDAMREARDAKLKVFYAECAKLTGWCRQQLTNLEAMQEPDHIQEYCATLADNYPTMSNNFAVLLDSVHEYVRANLVPVHKALLEAEEVWLYLQVSTLERLSKTLFEIHPKSPLDVEVKKYMSYPEHAAKFLEDFERCVAAQSSQHGEVGELDTIQRECQEVRYELCGEFAELPREVQAFSQRAQALRLGYQCFREAVLHRLTYVSPVANTVLESKRRQDEFDDCVRELKSWAAEASHGESWRDIYSKIVEIKQMIKSEQSSLEKKRGRAMTSTRN
ncbi:hypothetical protein LPMP_351980 [Leishmania panamensis]|uniref:Uncharacterized protein n=1 Tax=Leishmania panamensis TaxID=5679 RepID=A0A088S411_LEIPA|nr:hypothetical protein LPMP_351980 [Leishmania panamensis]AIO02335.1 hypothetical protein LPMP_351980 [Leishmania panamensis]